MQQNSEQMTGFEHDPYFMTYNEQYWNSGPGTVISSTAYSYAPEQMLSAPPTTVSYAHPYIPVSEQPDTNSKAFDLNCQAQDHQNVSHELAQSSSLIDGTQAVHSSELQETNSEVNSNTNKALFREG